MKRFRHHGLCWTRRLLALGILLLATLLLIGHGLSHQVERYADPLLAQLAQRLAVPVQADSLTAEWQGLNISLQVQGLRIGTGESRLHLAQLVARPDLLASLRSRSLIWSRFEASGATLPLQELPTGHWALAGIPLRGGTGGNALEQMLLGSRLLSLRDANLTVRLLDGTKLELHLNEARLDRAHGLRRYRVDADFGTARNRLEFVAELLGPGAQFAALDGRAYLRIAGHDIREIHRAAFARLLPQTKFELSTAPALQAEFWANLRAARPIELQGTLSLDAVPIGLLGSRSELGQVSANLAASLAPAALTVDVRRATVQRDERTLTLPDLCLQRTPSADGVAYQLRLPELDLEWLATTIPQLSALPDWVAKHTAALNPTGTLRGVRIDLPARDPAHWQLSAQLDTVGLDSFRDSPAVRNLNGLLTMNAQRGRIQLAGTDLRLRYPGVYSDWLSHSQVQGELAWSIDPENHRILVHSDDLRAQFGQARAHAALVAGIPLRPDSFLGPTLSLSLGLQNIAWPAHRALLPDLLLPADLRQWLDSALTKTHLPQAAVVYRGTTRFHMPAHRTAQIRLRTKDTELAYLPDWPPLYQPIADLWLSNIDLIARAPTGRLLELNLADMRLKTARSPGQYGLQLSTHASGPSRSGLALLHTPDLRQHLGAGLDGLKLTGDLSGDLALFIPLDKAPDLANLRLQTQINLRNNRLHLTDLDLELTHLNGQLQYDQQGLSSKDLNATLWGQPLTLEITETRTPQAIEIATSGRQEIRQIANWLKMPALNALSGSTAVRGQLRLHTGPAPRPPDTYQFHAAMQQVQSNLPTPLNKPAGRPAPLQVQVTTARAADTVTRLRWQLPPTTGQNHPSELQLELLQAADRPVAAPQFKAGRLSLNANLPAFRDQSLIAQLNLAQLDLATLLPTQAANPAPDPTLLTQPILGLNPHFNLEVEQATLGPRKLGPLTVRNRYEPGTLHLELATDYTQGTLSLPPSSALPQITVQHLDIDALFQRLNPTKQSTADEPATTPTLDPQRIPAMQIKIESLTASGTERGNFSATLKPTAAGVRIADLRGGLGSAQFQSTTAEEDASHIFWGRDSTGQFTEARLRYTFEDIGDLFRMGGLEPPLKSATGTFATQLRWRGAPYEFADSRPAGTFEVHAERGAFYSDRDNVTVLLKAIGLFNFNSWARRLRLDFDDVTEAGTPYDALHGQFALHEQKINTLAPVKVELPAGSMRFDGSVDLAESAVDARLVVTLPARQNMTWIAALVAGLPAAPGVWLAGRIFDDRLDSLSSVSYRVEGSLDKPKIVTEKIFESSINN